MLFPLIATIPDESKGIEPAIEVAGRNTIAKESKTEASLKLNICLVSKKQELWVISLYPRRKAWTSARHQSVLNVKVRPR